MRNNLTTIAALPGSGGGHMAWQPAEVWTRPAQPKKFKAFFKKTLQEVLKGIEEPRKYDVEDDEPAPRKIKAKAPAKAPTYWVENTSGTARAKRFIDMDDNQLDVIHGMCSRKGEHITRNGFTPKQYVQAIEAELARRCDDI